MDVLSNLEPKRVFEIFEDICNIPHPSGNMDKIGDYLCDFAEKNNLRYIREDCGNVMIFVPGSPGYEDADIVMLQGHLDMVCEKSPDSRHKFETDPLPIAVMEDVIFSKKTALGGNGIAIGICLALAEQKDTAHPPLEIVMTANKEHDMQGVKELDASVLNAKTLINLDNDKEGVFITSCAGGLKGRMQLPVKYNKKSGEKYNIVVSGFKGGHSGKDINKYGGNANIIMGRLLHLLSSEFEFELVNLRGGLMVSAIPRDADCTILVSDEDVPKLEAVVEDFENTIKNEYRANENNVQIYCNDLGYSEEEVLTLKTMERLIFILNTLPDGVQKMSMDTETPGLVEASLNIGIMRLTDKEFLLEATVRSSVASEKYFLSDKLRYLTETIGGRYEELGDYPGWEFKSDSRLLKVMQSVYMAQNGTAPVITGVHAGLETGILSAKLPGLDIISCGPDIFNIRTPNERLSISSVERTWKFLLAVLKELK